MWRLTVLTLGIVLGVAVAPAAFAAADPATVSITLDAPAETTQVWLDGEGITAHDMSGTISQADGEPAAIDWGTTVGGPGARSAAQPGKLTLSLTTSSDALSRKPMLAVTFADDAGVVLASKRFDLLAESDGSAGAAGSDAGSNSSSEAGANGTSTSKGTDGATPNGTANGTGKGGTGLARTGGLDLGVLGGVAALLLIAGGALAVARTSQLKRRTTSNTEEPGA